MRFKQNYYHSERLAIKESAISVAVRPLLERDFQELKRLFTQIYPSHERFSSALALAAYQQSVQVPGNSILCAVDESRILSICSVSHVPKITWAGKDTALLGLIYTDIEYRRLGFGRLILQAATGVARKIGAQCLTVIAGRDEDSIAGLCRSQGFVVRNCQYIKRLT